MLVWDESPIDEQGQQVIQEANKKIRIAVYQVIGMMNKTLLRT